MIMTVRRSGNYEEEKKPHTIYLHNDFKRF